MVRKAIPCRTKLLVFARDNYTCQFCGRTPGLFPGLFLDVDHIIPVSKGGTNDLKNLQTSCASCNRSKGNHEELNKAYRHELHARLSNVNPEILKLLASTGKARVVAEQIEFDGIKKTNDLAGLYEITIIPNTLVGMGAGKNFGIYTLNDHGGTKINFQMQVREEEQSQRHLPIPAPT